MFSLSQCLNQYPTAFRMGALLWRFLCIVALLCILEPSLSAPDYQLVGSRVLQAAVITWLISRTLPRWRATYDCILALPFLLQNCHLYMAAVLATMASLPLIICHYVFANRPYRFTSIAESLFWATLWVGFVISVILFPHPIADSWQQYSLALSYGTDHVYQMNHVRQAFIPDTKYVIGFPPLYSILYRLSMEVFRQDVVSFLYMNFIVVGLIFATMKKIFQCIHQPELTVCCMLLLICSYNFYSFEVCGLGTIVLNVWFILVAIWLVVRQNNRCDWLSRNDAEAIAFLLGLAAMNRFDALLWGIGTLFALSLVKLWKKQWVHALVPWCIFALLISPWMVYSIRVFGVAFISDNAERVLSTGDIWPHTYRSSSHPAPMWYDHIPQWLQMQQDAFVHQLRQFMRNSMKFVFLASGMGLLLAGRRERIRNIITQHPLKSSEQCLSIATIGVGGFLSLCSIAATRYSFELRYNSCFAIYLVMLMMSLMISWTKCHKIFSIVIICIIVAKGYQSWPSKEIYHFRNAGAWSELASRGRNWIQPLKPKAFSPTEASLYAYLRQNMSADEFFCTTYPDPQVNFHKFVAVSDLNSLLFGVQQPQDWIDYFRDYHVRYFYCNYDHFGDSEHLQITKGHPKLQPTEIPHLYRFVD